MKTATITLSILGMAFATACGSPPPKDQSGVKVNNAGLEARMNRSAPAAEEAPAEPAAEAAEPAAEAAEPTAEAAEPAAEATEPAAAE